MAGGEAASIETQAPALVRVCLQRAAHHAILEQYQRRTDASAARVIGAIMGTVRAVGPGQFVADVRQAYAVPHSEVGDQVAINGEHFHARMALHRRCYGRDAVLLGWYEVAYAETATNQASDNFVREFFARETGAAGAPQAVCLRVKLHGEGRVETFAFRCSSAAAGRTAPADLSDVPLEIAFGASELFALDAVARTWLQDTERTTVPLPSPATYRSERGSHLEGQLAVLRAHAASDPEAAVLLSLLGDASAESLSEDAQILASCRASLATAAGAMARSLADSDRILLAAPVPTLPVSRSNAKN